MNFTRSINMDWMMRNCSLIYVKYENVPDETQGAFMSENGGKIHTQLFGLLANSPLCRRLAVRIQRVWWVTAVHVAPASLLFVDNTGIKWIVTEGCIWCIRWTSPAFNCWGWNEIIVDGGGQFTGLNWINIELIISWMVHFRVRWQANKASV